MKQPRITSPLAKLPALQLPELPTALRFQVDRVAEPHFNVETRATGGLIEIFDVIGDDGATPARVSAALRHIGRAPALVRLNSPGGDYFDGAAIYNLLREHPAPVTVQVLGVAASAASVVAMAGERIEIARNAQIMVHRAWLVALGNGDVMARAVEVLRQVDEALAEIYTARTGQPIARVREIMAAETYLQAAALFDQDGLPAPSSAG